MPDRMMSTLWVLIVSCIPSTTIRIFFTGLPIWIAFIPSLIIAVAIHDPLHNWMKKHIYN